MARFPSRANTCARDRRSFPRVRPTTLLQPRRRSALDSLRRLQGVVVSSDCLCSCLYSLISGSFVFSSFKRLPHGFFQRLFSCAFPSTGPIREGRHLIRCTVLAFHGSPLSFCRDRHH